MFPHIALDYNTTPNEVLISKLFVAMNVSCSSKVQSERSLSLSSSHVKMDAAVFPTTGNFDSDTCCISERCLCKRNSTRPVNILLAAWGMLASHLVFVIAKYHRADNI
jgi:hypothetical protein